MSQAPRDLELEARVMELVSGGTASRDELNELLRQDKAARQIAARVLIEESVLISELRLDNARGLGRVFAPRSFPAAQSAAPSRERDRRHQWIAIFASLAAAACIVAALWLHQQQGKNGTGGITSAHAQEASVGLMRQMEGDTLRPHAVPVVTSRKIELGAERARIDLDNGVVISATGPARMMVGLHGLRLWQGEVIVDVPEDTASYVVETDDGRFIDLGTVFSVSVQQEKQTEMAVLSGEVRAERLTFEGDVLEMRSLREAQGVIIERQGGGIRKVEAGDLRTGAPILAGDQSLVVSPTYRELVAAARPLLVWDFEEITANNTIPNRAGPDLHGIIQGDPEFGGTAENGRHLVLGRNDRSGWIDANGPWRKADTDPFTLELWARPDRVQWGHLFQLWVDRDMDLVFQQPPEGQVSHFFLEFTHTRKFHPMPNRPAVRAGFRSPATQHASETLPGGLNAMLASPDRYIPGVWHHLVVRVGRQNFTLFVNGQAVTRQAINRPDHGEKELFIRLGRLGDGKYQARQFVGAIDEVALYPRALSDAEVRRHYRAMTGEEE